MNPVQDILDIFLPYGNTLEKVLLYFIGSAILSFAIAPLIIKFLYYFKIRRVAKGDEISRLDEEKGKLGTPVMGGLIFIIPTIIITFVFNWKREYTWLPIGALLLSACLGGVDDILNIFGKDRKQPKPIKLHLTLARVHKSFAKRIFYLLTLPWAAFKRFLLFAGSKPTSGLQVHEKLLVQGFIGLTVGYWVYHKLGWSDVWVPYIFRFDTIRSLLELIPGFIVNQGTSSIDIGWVMVPFVALTIMTVSNATNITDGMDGLAGGLVLMAFISYTIIAFNISQAIDPSTNLPIGTQDYRFIAYLCATAAGALLAYLYFNVKPARVQMSDLGSLGIGTLLSIIAIILHREITLLLIAGVSLFNSVFAIILQKLSRKFRHRKLFRITPLHYHFELKGWPEEKVVMRFWIVSGLLCAIGIWMASI